MINPQNKKKGNYKHKNYIDMKKILLAVIIVLMTGNRAQAQTNEFEQTRQNLPTVQARAEVGDINSMYQLGYYYNMSGETDKAIECYTKAAEKGHAIAQNNLAFEYRKKGETERAIYWYKKAIDNKIWFSADQLGELYYRDLNDLETAAPYYHLAAEGKVTIAYHHLAYYYDKKGEIEKAIEWYKKSIEANDQLSAVSMSNLANIYRNMKEIEKAIPLYKQAIEKGDMYGAYFLGELYRVDKQNPEAAIPYYEMAIEKGIGVANISLGTYYRRTKNYHKAIECFKTLAEKNELTAIEQLAQIYLYELNDQENGFIWAKKGAALNYPPAYDQMANYYLRQGAKDPAKNREAIPWLEKGIQSGSVHAMINMGNLYYHGNAGEQNYEKAFALYLQAHQKGHVDKEKLAACYILGQGVKKDEVKGFKLLKENADKYDGNKWRLALCFFYGIGTAIDYEKAYQLNQEIIERPKNNLNRCYMDYIMGLFYETGHVVGKDGKKAFEYYMSGAKIGFTYALYRIAMCYYNGIGTAKNNIEGDKYMRMAADKGYEKADEFLRMTLDIKL